MSRGSELAARLRGDLRGRALWVVLGCAACQLGLGFGYVLGPLARPILDDLEWSRATFSAARPIQLLVQAGASPLVGWLVLRTGTRHILLASVLLIGLCFTAYSRMQAPLVYYAIAVAMGLALAGVGDVTAGHMVSQWVQRRRGAALGLVYAGSNAAGYLFIPFAIAVARETSWRDSLLAMGGVALFAMLPVAWLGLRDRASALPERGAYAEGAGEPEEVLSLREAAGTRSFWILAFSLFAFFAYFLGMLEHLVLFLTDRGMPLGEASSQLRNALGYGLATKLVVGVVADRIPNQAALLCDYGLLAASSLLLLWLPDPALTLPFVIGFGVATAARDVVYPMAVVRCFGAATLAPIYGMLMLALLPGAVVGNWLAALFHDAVGSYDRLFAGLALLNVVSFASLFLLRDERRERARRLAANARNAMGSDA